MIDELIADMEALGLKIESVTNVQRDTLIKTECGIDIWVFDLVSGIRPCLEYDGLGYFTDGATVNDAVSIVNAYEAIRLALVTH